MDASQVEDQDPYAPRSFDEYYSGQAAETNTRNNDSDSSAAEQSREQQASSSNAPSSSSRGTGGPSESEYPSSFRPTSSRNGRSNAAPPQVQESDEADEPLFGGTPFRDSFKTGSGGAHAGEGDDEQGGAVDRDHLYALLNVERDASEEQIREAYRSLAVSFHPDKHTDPALKSAAESRFREVQHAYEVLTNPQQRAVYDHLGESGLKASWALTVRGQTPQDLQREFERQAMERRMQDAENLIKSRGDFTVSLDASALFAPANRIPRPAARAGRPVTLEDRWNRVGATQMLGKHGFETGITDRVSVNFAGQMVSSNGVGNGNLIGTVKTQWSPKLFSEVSATLLRPRIGTIKGQYVINPNSFLTFLVASQTTVVPPSVTLTYGQRISSTSALTGFSSIKTGSYTIGPWGQNAPAFYKRDRAALTIGISKQTTPDRGWTVQSCLNESDPSVGGEYAAKVLSNSVKVRAGVGLGLGSGLNVFTSAERRLTENTSLTLGINFGLPAGGVTLRVKVQRLGQKINVPILISPYFRSDLVVICTALPAITYTALHYGYLVPAKRRRISRKVAELRTESRDLIEERYRAAVEAKALLRDQARKRAISERKRGGLVIVEAWYGARGSFPSPKAGLVEELLDQVWSQQQQQGDASAALDMEGVDVTTLPPYWDVTVPLQNLVTNGQLIIPGGRPKFGINGFFDPCMGERKHLFVRYVFRHQLHEVQVDDVAPLAAPLRIHQLV
ncbi:unnamed protein product [Tilletia laevis]|uniref:J domain-containing protein n=3 Tax=Tilletia TaxID=13289 RepID=A0A8X7MX04_9BASI|nr:hypothetical protein CF336_g1812 [Tilletia laevis]KAE8203295.1 hypothetical protein CF328_g1729 [Tilletia controversa]KAE8263909.1 hypothetical protein A4X03_0g1336 [Tilletia caries]KAE8204001.1 hypothetical protein CF335_g2813 [Tilletia laevis]KAE8252502.1 hypothetical protein A4X06_0g2146 [Tilletia controversa]